MQQIDDTAWTRRGFSILWSPAALGRVCQKTTDIISVRTMLRIRQWPDNLPSADGNGLIVTGMEGCIDRMAPDEASEWLAEKIIPVMYRFQDVYDEAALIFWLESGERRVKEHALDDGVNWLCAPPMQHEEFPLSRNVFGGAYKGVQKIVEKELGDPNNAAAGWIGVYLSRMS